ncbi:threonine synthase [Halanaerobacter jeridensis]|uniref:Threonine synthase n=1 Tax=Halanaerobacter jeridensis TaxID=706427 RepID=A0A938XXW8_9FIRM|nr:threonine synthase [Halanaerobacter jeridensis]MBM7557310.1 threonine synthase [Halanaerobacter jeridensis]
MEYISTRGNYDQVSSAEAIQLGMVPSGGLFVPQEVPQLKEEEIYQFQSDSYQTIAKKVLAKFLSDYNAQELEEIVNQAYNGDNFATEEIAPLVNLEEEQYILELWHGPTAAFKDMALQLMPYLLQSAIDKVELEEDVVILVATSGDTGKAALEGFKDLDGIDIIVFYPQDGVSKIQEYQMITTEGDNTAVVAVEGNFDDCQSTVKEVFGDQDFKELLEQSGYRFSSANSINWGRLVPQIIYYFAAYAYLLKDNKIEPGEEINISVPTGNFGNILAGYYAHSMGLPVNKFVCASNDNKVLTDFLATGVYDINREFKKTISPSMDILISSNLERFLFEMTDHDAEKINEWYQQLQEEGKFEIDQRTKEKIKSLFTGAYATEAETKETIKEVYENNDYLLDPHTAVGVESYRKALEELSEEEVTVIDSTANPYKFSRAVLEALTGEKREDKDDFAVLEELQDLTGQEAHRALQGLDERKIRHQRNCTSSDIKDEIKDILELNQ